MSLHSIPHLAKGFHPCGTPQVNRRILIGVQMTGYKLNRIQAPRKPIRKPVKRRAVSKSESDYLIEAGAKFAVSAARRDRSSIFDDYPELRYMNLSPEILRSIYLDSLVIFEKPGVPAKPEPDGYGEFVLRSFAARTGRRDAHDFFRLNKKALRKYLSEYRSYRCRDSKKNFTRVVLPLCDALRKFPANVDDYKNGIADFRINGRIDVAIAIVWIERLKRHSLHHENTGFYSSYRPHHPEPRKKDEVKALIDKHHRMSDRYKKVKISNNAAEMIEAKRREFEAKREAFEAKSNLPPGRELEDWKKYIFIICDFDKQKIMEFIRNVYLDKESREQKLNQIKRDAKRYFAASENERFGVKAGARFRIKVPVDPKPANKTPAFRR